MTILCSIKIVTTHNRYDNNVIIKTVPNHKSHDQFPYV